MSVGDLFQALVATWNKHVLRATRRLRFHPSLTKLVHGTSSAAFLGGGGGWKRLSLGKGKGGKRSKEEEDTVGVWQRTILMGEKCQPLDFSGVIYYDNRGRQVAEYPAPPRTPPRRSPVNSFSYSDSTVSRAE